MRRHRAKALQSLPVDGLLCPSRQKCKISLTFRSQDSVRRAFEDADKEVITAWIDQQMDRTFASLLELTQAGTQNASEYAQPTLFGWLEARDRKLWPTFVRGDIAYGNENMMAGLEQRKLSYLFTLRQSKNVSRTIARLAKQGNKVDWQSSGQGWESLQGWTRERRVIVSRQKTAEQKVEAGSKGSKQPVLPGTMMEQSGGD